MTAPDGSDPEVVQRAEDFCALPLVRRLAALLDRDPSGFADGDPLPHGWHVVMFNVPTRQSQLRPDGAAQLGVELPDLGLPRLMMAGRRIDFPGEILIGGAVVRESRLQGVTEKSGRSGRFAIVEIQHRLLSSGDREPAVVETTSYVLREASEAKSDAPPQAPSTPASEPIPGQRIVTPDEAMLFRYSAITDNPHRIHYDLAYARQVEGYPGLVVNGSLPLMLLLELLRDTIGREPKSLKTRNMAPLYCGRPLALRIAPAEDGWVLGAHDDHGILCMEATAW